MKNILIFLSKTIFNVIIIMLVYYIFELLFNVEGGDGTSLKGFVVSSVVLLIGLIVGDILYKLIFHSKNK